MIQTLHRRSNDTLSGASALGDLSTLFARVHWSNARTRRSVPLRCAAPAPGKSAWVPQTKASKFNPPSLRVTNWRDEAVHLPHRELETLRMLAKGFTVGQAAGLMGLSSHTVASYTRDVYRKLGVTCRAEATIEAARLGLIGF